MIIDISRKRARNRWLVAYTLLQNPSIQCLRASNLRAKREDDLSSNNGYEPLEEGEIQENEHHLTEILTFRRQ